MKQTIWIKKGEKNDEESKKLLFPAAGAGAVPVSAPDSFEGMVKDSELATNYAMYWGTWVDADNNSELIVAMADSGDEVRFDLYQDGSIEASGFVQFSQEYSGTKSAGVKCVMWS